MFSLCIFSGADVSALVPFCPAHCCVISLIVFICTVTYELINDDDDDDDDDHVIRLAMTAVGSATEGCHPGSYAATRRRCYVP